jgi:hypothetical protein
MNKTDEFLVTLFRKKLKDGGVNLKWWINKHLPEWEYSAAFNRIKGYTKGLGKEIKAAIEEYLKS